MYYHCVNNSKSYLNYPHLFFILVVQWWIWWLSNFFQHDTNKKSQLLPHAIYNRDPSTGTHRWILFQMKHVNLFESATIISSMERRQWTSVGNIYSHLQLRPHCTVVARRPPYKLWLLTWLLRMVERRSFTHCGLNWRGPLRLRMVVKPSVLWCCLAVTGDMVWTHIIEDGRFRKSL